MVEDKIRVMLVDDYVVMRKLLGELLCKEPDMAIVGEASDGESAVGFVRKVLPDVILMDIEMPCMNGIQAMRFIHNELPDVRIIGLSMFEESEIAATMRSAGAVDYLTKTAPSGTVLAAIRGCSPS